MWLTVRWAGSERFKEIVGKQIIDFNWGSYTAHAPLDSVGIVA